MPELRVDAEALLEAAEAGRLRIPVEVGAFLVLSCVEQIAAHPRAFSPRDVTLDDTGAVHVRAAGATGEHEAALAATELLRRLLLASAGASPSSLLRWLERSREATTLSLEAMRDEVEAALVPLNREAATRLLARFIRSSARADAHASPTFDDGALDAELDRFLRRDHGAPEARGEKTERVAERLREKPPERGPSVGITVVVIALAALLGIALSHPDLFGG